MLSRKWPYNHAVSGRGLEVIRVFDFEKCRHQHRQKQTYWEEREPSKWCVKNLYTSCKEQTSDGTAISIGSHHMIQPARQGCMVKIGILAVINHGKHYKGVCFNASNTAFLCMVQLVYTNGQDCLTLVSRIKIKSSLCQVLNQRKCVIIQGCTLSQILSHWIQAVLNGALQP